MKRKTKDNKKRTILLSRLLACVLFTILILPQISHADFSYPLMEQFPGFFNSGSTPTFPQLLTAIYNFGLWTVGIAAFAMLVIGGFMYITSAGNTSAAGTAKKVITDALLGLTAALLAYLLLYVINPDLVNLNLNLIKVGINNQGVKYSDSVATESSSSGGSSVYNGGSTCTGNNIGCCKVGTRCGNCNNCVNFSNSYSNLCYKGAAGSTGCKLNSALANKLSSINLGSVGAEVSEAWPPTVIHSDGCHANGTCADIRCKKGCDNESKENIKKIYDTLKSAGFKVVYEGNNCSAFNAIGVYCTRYSTTTGSSFHAEM